VATGRQGERRVLGGLIDDMLRGLEDARDSAAEALFEPTLRLGVTGLSRSGKTVFITALVAALLDRGRMGGLSAEGEGRIEAVALRPQPDLTAPRFAYEAHRAALSGPEPRWPESTRSVAQLRLSIRYRGKGFLSGMGGAAMLHLDIVDYPGEWLLDLPLMELDFEAWSAQAFAAARTPRRAPLAADWLAAVAAVDPEASHDEAAAAGLAAAYTDYLQACRKDGLAGLAPGRFLMPGELEGTPALAFSPLPPGRGARGTLRAELRRRYEGYRTQVVKPFFRDHFARIDRQVVLVDLLGALDAGPGAVADLREAMTGVLAAFRPGAQSWLGRLMGLRSVERILFAATKADHVHHDQHGRMTAILSALLRDSVSRAAFRGAKVEAMAIASLRATSEQIVERGGVAIPCVRGRLAETGREAALHPGDLPDDPERVLAEAVPGAPRGRGWLGGDLRVMTFAPPPPGGRPGDGPPHLRLDRALEFLIGDRLA
jgi:predicted YcjX-like family ATPase